jgi:hypothetical protein
MEPESSILPPHKRDACPYPEPDQSNPRLQKPISLRFFLMLSSDLRLSLPSGLLLSGLPIKTL